MDSSPPLRGGWTPLFYVTFYSSYRTVKKSCWRFLRFMVALSHARVIVQTVSLSFFSFYFLDALQSDYNNTTVMFVGINMFLVLLKAHFNPRPTTRPEMTLSQALNIFVPAKINSLVYLLSRDVVTSDVYRDVWTAYC